MSTLFGRLGLRNRGNKFITGTAFSAAAVALVAGAVIYPGFKTAEVDLNDGGVWVVSKARNAVGRLNYPSRVLDGAVTPASTTFDVLQNAGKVFVDDESGSTLNQVSAANMRLGGDKQLPGSAQVSFGTEVISVTDPAENSRPQPRNLTARVVAAGTVRIPVPLAGIDPDGDSVQLTGIDSTPAMGTATAGSNFIDFCRGRRRSRNRFLPVQGSGPPRGREHRYGDRGHRAPRRHKPEAHARG